MGKKRCYNIIIKEKKTYNIVEHIDYDTVMNKTKVFSISTIASFLWDLPCKIRETLKINKNKDFSFAMCMFIWVLQMKQLLSEK
jgi:hypothetical protein